MAGQTINVSITADTGQFSKAMRGLSGKDGLGGFGKALSTLGGNISSVGKSLTTRITMPALAAAGAVGGITAALGWSRLKSLDTAQGQLKGLGYEGTTLQGIMDGVNDGVTGTALSLADGTALMVGALATGNLELKDTEAYVRRVANVSAAYNLDSSHAGLLLNNVLTKNKVTYGDLSQMVQNGIPIISALAKEYDVTGDQIEKMVRDGKIGIEDLNRVLDKNAGAAAEEYGKTWEGITANIRANIGRIGAELLGPVFDIVKGKGQEFLDLLRSPEWADSAAAIGTAIGNLISDAIDRIMTLIQWWNNLSEGTKQFIGALAGVAVAAGPFLIVLGKVMTIVGKVLPLIGLLAKAFVLLVSPIGLVVAAVAALAAGLVYFFTQTETGAALWDTIWSGILTAVESVSAWFTGTFLPAMQGVWDGILVVAQAVADWFMSELLPTFQQWGDQLLAIWDSLVALWEAVWDGLVDIWETVGVPIFAAIVTVLQALEPVWRAIWDQIKIIADTIWKNIKTIVSTALDVIRGVIDTATALIRGDWSGAWEAIRGIADTIWNGIKSVISTAINAVKATVSNVLSAIGGVFSNIWSSIQGTVTGAINAVKSTISSVLTSIRTTWSSGWDRVKSALDTAWESIKRAVTVALGAVVSTIAGLPGRILAVLRNAGTVLYQTGVNLIQGLLNGVGNMAAKIGNWFLDKVPGWIRTPLKKALGISSPSKEFAGYGRNIGEGLIAGIEGMSGRIESASADMAAGVVDGWADPTLAMSTHGVATGAGRLAGQGPLISNLNIKVSLRGDESPREAGRQIAEGLIERLSYARGVQ